MVAELLRSENLIIAENAMAIAPKTRMGRPGFGVWCKAHFPLLIIIFLKHSVS